jgi:hypothetical protein
VLRVAARVTTSHGNIPSRGCGHPPAGGEERPHRRHLPLESGRGVRLRLVGVDAVDAERQLPAGRRGNDAESELVVQLHGQAARGRAQRDRIDIAHSERRVEQRPRDPVAQRQATTDEPVVDDPRDRGDRFVERAGGSRREQRPVGGAQEALRIVLPHERHRRLRDRGVDAADEVGLDARRLDRGQGLEIPADRDAVDSEQALAPVRIEGGGHCFVGGVGRAGPAHRRHAKPRTIQRGHQSGDRGRGGGDGEHAANRRDAWSDPSAQ